MTRRLTLTVTAEVADNTDAGELAEALFDALTSDSDDVALPGDPRIVDVAVIEP